MSESLKEFMDLRLIVKSEQGWNHLNARHHAEHLAQQDNLPKPNPFKYSSGSRALEDWMIGPEELWHEMSDEELMWRASMVPRISKYPKNRTRKVAFMFLSRGSLPLGPLWDMFFKGYAGLYSVYLHTSPEFTKEPPESSVFYKRKISSKVINL